MIECNINNINKSYGAHQIFQNISFDIKTNERIGLIGPNGCGKTTIMKIMIGTEHVQEGTVTFRKGTKLGYLDQIPDFDDTVKVIDILESAFGELFTIKHQMDQLADTFGQLGPDELDKGLKEFSRLTEIFEKEDGYNMETNISKVATGLKIDHMREMDFNVLSGGEKTRVMLAKILLENPSILMLDEPTNHLDLDSIEWLESYLKDYDGSVLIVSHDRYFLDNVCKKIVELSEYKAYVYHGNYSYYVVEKERRFLLEMKVYMAQDRKIKRMENQIERYRIWGRMRDSDKMFKRAKELERRLEKVERLDKPKQDNPKMKIKNAVGGRSGKRVLEAEHISKSFDDLVLLKDASIELIYQDRLAILGKNGSGKSTLIHMLLEDFPKEDSMYKWGTKINIGYLPQEVKFDDEEQSVLEYFMHTHELNQNRARGELAKALFIRDDVFKKIKNLSGGEKSKLKLCSLTFNRVNFMILDEPTNHLDIDSREILEELLLDFDGTILFVSHDRYFIKKIANRICEIDNLTLNYYEGDYDYFKFMKSKQLVAKKEGIKSSKTVRSKQPPSRDILQEIEKLEEKMQKIERLMEEHSYDAQKLTELYAEKEDLKKEHQELYQLLEEL